MKKNFKLILCMLFILTLCFVSCDNTPLTGSFSISFKEDISRSPIKPNISLDVKSYKVSVIGPASIEDEVIDKDATYSRSELPVGKYTVTVTALNADGIEIGEGSSTFNLKNNDTQTVQVIVKELEGDGKLTITLDGSVLTTETYTLTIYDSSKSVVGEPIEFTKNSSDKLVASTDLENGFYSFTVTHGNKEYYSEAFRIVKGDSIGAVATIAPDSTITITIATEIKQNPALSLSVSTDDPEINKEFTVSVAGISGSNISYTWLIDNKKQAETSSTLTINKDKVDTYNVKCIVSDKDNKIVWSVEKDIFINFPLITLKDDEAIAWTMDLLHVVSLIEPFATNFSLSHTGSITMNADENGITYESKDFSVVVDGQNYTYNGKVVILNSNLSKKVTFTDLTVTLSDTDSTTTTTIIGSLDVDFTPFSPQILRSSFKGVINNERYDFDVLNLTKENVAYFTLSLQSGIDNNSNFGQYRYFFNENDVSLRKGSLKEIYGTSTKVRIIQSGDVNIPTTAYAKGDIDFSFDFKDSFTYSIILNDFDWGFETTELDNYSTSGKIEWSCNEEDKIQKFELTDYVHIYTDKEKKYTIKTSGVLKCIQVGDGKYSMASFKGTYNGKEYDFTWTAPTSNP